jgi:hypothetical protein
MKHLASAQPIEGLPVSFMTSELPTASYSSSDNIRTVVTDLHRESAESSD